MKSSFGEEITEVKLPLQKDIEAWLRLWSHLPGSNRLISEHILCSDLNLLLTVNQLWNVDTPESPCKTINELAEHVYARSRGCVVHLSTGCNTESIALQFKCHLDTTPQKDFTQVKIENSKNKRCLKVISTVHRAAQLLPLSIFTSHRFLTVEYKRIETSGRQAAVIVVSATLASLLLLAALLFTTSSYSLYLAMFFAGLFLASCISTLLLIREPRLLINKEGINMPSNQVAAEMAEHVMGRHEEILSIFPATFRADISPHNS